MIITRVLAWASVVVAGAVSVIWLVVGAVILGIALAALAGLLMPIAALSSIVRRRR